MDPWVSVKESFGFAAIPHFEGQSAFTKEPHRLDRAANLFQSWDNHARILHGSSVNLIRIAVQFY